MDEWGCEERRETAKSLRKSCLCACVKGTLTSSEAIFPESRVPARGSRSTFGVAQARCAKYSDYALVYDKMFTDISIRVVISLSLSLCLSLCPSDHQVSGRSWPGISCLS